MFWFFIGIVMGIYLDQTFTIPNLHEAVHKMKSRQEE